MTAAKKTILITGCSSGIGYDSALRFKEMGWQVLATCRKAEDVKRLQQEGFESFIIDYEDEATIHQGFDEAMRRANGKIDVLFNNGAYGIPVLLKTCQQMRCARFLKQISLAGIR